MSGEDDLNIFEKTWVLLVGICILRRSKNITPILLVQRENKVRRGGGGRVGMGRKEREEGREGKG